MKRTELSSFRALSSIETTQAQWLWRGRIPLGAVTLLDGDPASGKSTLSYDIAARVTRGLPMPFETDALPGAGVVLLQAEDHLGSAVRPRLEAAGAELDRVLVYDRESAVGGPLVFPEGADLLADAASSIGARLIVVDPLSAYLSHGTTSEHRARNAIEPLIAIAQRYNLAVVAVRHLTKNGTTRAMRRGLGSMGLIAAARSGLFVAADPLATDPSRRVFALAKGSLGSAASLAYRTHENENGVLGIEWLGETQQHADELAGGESEPSALEEAINFLRETLSEGRLPANEVLGLGSEAGIPERTIRRAKAILRIKSRPEGSGPKAQWFCHSPATTPVEGLNKHAATPGVEADPEEDQGIPAKQSSSHPSLRAVLAQTLGSPITEKNGYIQQ